MTDDDQKPAPREWTMRLDTLIVNNLTVPQQHTMIRNHVEFLKVIEHSAYLEKCEELERVKAYFDNPPAEVFMLEDQLVVQLINRDNGKLLHLAARCDALEAARKELDDYKEQLKWSLRNEEKYKQWLDDALKAELEHKLDSSYETTEPFVPISELEELEAKLAKAREALVALKHSNNHTIDEELWRIEQALKEIGE